MLFVGTKSFLRAGAPAVRAGAPAGRARLVPGNSANLIQRLQAKAAAGSIGRGLREVGKGIKSGRFARRRLLTSAPAAMMNRMG